MSTEPDRIATAQAMLAELGVALADLHRAQRPPVPTMAEYLPQVIAAAGPGTRRLYACVVDQALPAVDQRRMDQRPHNRWIPLFARSKPTAATS